MMLSNRRKFYIKLICFLLIFVYIVSFSSAQTDISEEIIIAELQSKNEDFSQYCMDVEEAYKALVSHKPIEQKFYLYTCKKNDTPLTVSARCSIRYDTLVTLNHISSSKENLEGRTIRLPTINGIFIPENAENSLEILLQQEFAEQLAQNTTICYNFDGAKWYFIQNVKFSSTERTFFLDTSLVMPLAKSVLTSPFGMRNSPISGKWKMHTGIDLAAPVGSEVYACKSGKVISCVVGNATFGNYIILQHDNKMTSVYAHLSKMFVSKGQTVSKGAHIADVGLTGMTTGPHLHFEIRVDGNPQDPGKLLPSR